MPTIKFTLNGTPTEATYETGMHLLEVLRENLAFTRAELAKGARLAHARAIPQNG